MNRGRLIVERYKCLNYDVEMREKCFKCMRPTSSCMCKFTSPIKTDTRFVILVHPMEFKKVKNGTGILTHLQLTNSEVIVDLDFSQNKRVNHLLNDASFECFILYPGNNSINVSNAESKKRFQSNKQRVVFILDATWPCAKKMIKLSHNLHDVPFISFDNDQKSGFAIKQQPHELCLSTIESVKKVIDDFNVLGIESVATDEFLRPFEKMVEYQIECVLNPDNKNHHVTKNNKVRDREHYKKNPQRSLFFNKENF